LKALDGSSKFQKEDSTMKRKNRTFKYFPVVAFALSLMIGSTLAAHALPTGALIVGEIERMGVNNPADPWSAGWMTVGKDNVIIPANLLIELPANRLTLQQLFIPTPGNPVSGPPAACFANGESGLAKADKCNTRVLGATATVYANRMDTGHVIAGDVRLAKANESVSGIVTYINYTDGYFRVNGIHNPGPVDDNTGVMVRFNDPGPLNNPGFGRHTIQQGFGCLPGSLNCSADPRFTNDPENYTLTFQTGFPLCIPSTPPPGIDPNCPATNRPTPVMSPPVTNPPGTLVFPFVSVQIPGGTVDNSAHFAPIVLGDSLTAFGNYELIPGVLTGATFFSAHTTQVFADLATRDDPTQPDYTILREVGWDSPPFPAARVRLLFIGNSTLHGLTLGLTDPDTAVDIYASHYDQSNVAHNSPGDGIPVYSTSGFKKGAVAFGGVSGGMFQIHPGLQVELDPGILDKKALLDPCSSLSSAIDPTASGGPPPPPLFLADVRANCQLTAAPPISSILTGQLAVDEAYKFVAPIAKEGVAYTRHKQRNPGLASFDKNGNPAPNGQYLSPIPTTWAGYEDINIGLMQAPFSFSGIPWLLDRRVGPSGCIGPCESTPQPLTPFPFEGFNPSAVALRPSKANAAIGVPQPDLGRIFQFWPFGPTHQLAWDNAALTASATTGLPPITPVPNLLFVPPPPATAVTLTASPVGSTLTGDNVTFTALASGGSGVYEYQFMAKVAPAGPFVIGQPYQQINTWTWNTTGSPPGFYEIQVFARSVGSTAAVEAVGTLVYTLTVPPTTSVGLTAAPVSPVIEGSGVLFTATPTVGGTATHEYQFWYRSIAAATFSMAQDYSAVNTFTWTTTAGSYEWKVFARSAGSTAASEAISPIVPFVVTGAAPPPVSSVTLAASPVGSTLSGDNVTFTAVAAGGTGSYEYQFMAKVAPAGAFVVGRAYVASNTWTWDTTGSPQGFYEIQVFARSAGSTAPVEAVATLVYSLTSTPVSSVTLTANPVDNTATGNTIVYTATPAGGSGTYQYEFWARVAPSGTFVLARPYVAGNTWAWDSIGSPAGGYEVKVNVRNAGSPAPFEATTTIPYVLTAPPPSAPSSVSLAAVPVDNTATGGSVTYTATVTGGTGPFEYEFRARVAGGAFVLAQAYTPTNHWTWDTIGSPAGGYEVLVNVRRAGQVVPFEVTTTIPYVLTP
jgi:hypothetical protein